MAGFTYNAGDIEATATIDRDAFQEALDQMKADVDDFTSQTYTVNFDAQGDPAKATIDDIRASVDELTDHEYEMVFGADALDADEKFDFLHAQIDDLEMPVDIPIHVSDDLAQAKIAELEVLIGSLRAEVAGLNLDVNIQTNALAIAGNDIAALEGAGGGSGKSGIGNPFALLPNFLGSFAGLVTLGPALIALIQGLSVGIGGLVTMFSIAGVGALAFAAMAYEPIEKVVKAIEAGTQLSGPLGVLETNLLGLKKIFDQMEALAQPTIIAALVSATTQLDRILPALAPLFTSAAAGFTAFVDPIFDSMENQNFSQFISWLSEVGVGVANAFGTAVANIGIAWANWMQAFGPALPALEQGLKAVTGDWSTFAQGLQHSKGWESFLGNGLKDLQQMGILLGNIGNGIGQLFISVGPSGPTALSALNTGLEAIGKILTPLIGPLATLGAGLLTDLADFLSGLSGGGETTTKNFGKLIKQLGEEAKKSGPEFKKLGEDIGGILGPISKVSGPLVTLVGAINSAAPKRPLWDNVFPSDAGVGKGPWANITADSSKTQHNLLQSWAATATSFVYNINQWMKSVDNAVAGGLNEFAKGFAKVWNNVGQALNSWMENSVGPFFHKLPGNIVNAMSGMAGTVGGFFGKIWSGVSNGAQTWLTGTLEPWFEKLPNTIKGWLSGAGTWLVDVGEAIIHGIVTGIGNAVGDVEKALENVVKTIKNIPVIGGLIGSDSPYFITVGKAIGAGLASGITGSSGMPVVATQSMVSRVAGVGRVGIGTSSVGTLGSAGSGADSGLTQRLLAEVQGLRQDIRALPRDYKFAQRTR